MRIWASEQRFRIFSNSGLDFHTEITKVMLNKFRVSSLSDLGNRSEASRKTRMKIKYFEANGGPI